MASIATSTNLPALGPHIRDEVGHELQATLIDLVDLPLVRALEEQQWMLRAQFGERA
jgi:hypothetical protein